MKKVAYLAGKMTGIEDDNYPAFHAHAKLLEERGWVVQNPADNFGGAAGTELEHHQFIAMAIPQVLACDAIVLFGEWRQSKGACTEAAVALMAGKEVYLLSTHAKGFMLRVESSDITVDNMTFDPEEKAAL